jgi:hypothetical protein
VALGCAALLGFTANQASHALSLGGSLGTVLKVAGIGAAVRTFGPEINKTINSVLAQRGLSFAGATKVVPTLSIGRGAYIGAAQVQGARSFVDDVRAVGQAETRVGDVDLQLLIPLNTSTPTKGYKKIEGVGVSSLIDFEI